MATNPPVLPEPALPFHTAETDVLTPAQVACWRENGYALVNEVFPRALLEEMRAQVTASFPAAGSAEAESITEFGEGQQNFPFKSTAANEVALHPRLLRAVSQLLGVDVAHVRLTQSEVWPKYGRTVRAGEYDNQDQRIHCDFPNHTLTHPPPWDVPDAVEIILYLDEVDISGGATAIVPRSGPEDPAYEYPITKMPGFGDLEWKNDRESAEAYLARVAPAVADFRQTHLYPREKKVHYTFGTVLFYRHDTWHRGTPLKPGALRVVHNMTFRKSESEWISTLHQGWAWAMYHNTMFMEKLIAAASVEQRCVLGFPRPGHPYWTRATVLAVAARYGPLGLDVTPYASALQP
jgi:ectoine hydroxylase-related dioxygenase (phytanoyl-CoA dioxygenase family)